MFSRRIPGDVDVNRLSQLLSTMRREGRGFIDLTESNPTRAGFTYPQDLLAPLADPRGLAYRPSPLGLAEARRAVADDYARRDMAVSPARVALTASTSEAYSLLFKLLCDAGDEVLIPQPSYPLFEHLTQLDAVEAVPYRLEYHGRWTIDLSSVERALTSRTRALLVVNPNNPTGNFVTTAELDALAALCGPRGIALVSDEVFAEYDLDDGVQGDRGCLIDRDDVLGFTLGGLSKSVGLPQAKLGWIVASGADAVVDAAMARLELACDTYLSVSTPIQIAARAILERGADVRRQIQRRVRANLEGCRALVATRPACSLLHAEGGWYGVIRVPSLGSEEDLTLTLLQDAHVLVHPGYFFDFATESFVIVSLLPAPDVFVEGVSRVLGRFTMQEERA
jgi:hypothetical protein